MDWGAGSWRADSREAQEDPARPDDAGRTAGSEGSAGLPEGGGGRWVEDWQPGQDQPGREGDWVEVTPGVSVLAGSAEHEEALAAETIGDGVEEGRRRTSGAPSGRAGSGVQGRRTRRGILRWVGLGVLVVVLALVLRGVVAVAASPEGAGGGPASPGSTLPSLAPDAREGDAAGAADPAAPDWWAVLGTLDKRRTAALAATDAGALDGYLAGGSSAWAAEAQLIEELKGAGVKPEGLSTTILAVERVQKRGEPSGSAGDGDQGEKGGGVGVGAVGGDRDASEPPGPARAGPGGDQVEVVIVDSRSAYTLVDASGEVVRQVPAAPERRWRITLTPVEDPPSASEDPGWRISEVEQV